MKNIIDMTKIDFQKIIYVEDKCEMIDRIIADIKKVKTFKEKSDLADKLELAHEVFFNLNNEFNK